MTAIEECLSKLVGKNGQQWGIVHTWVKQGVLQPRDFKLLMIQIIEREVQVRILHGEKTTD